MTVVHRLHTAVKYPRFSFPIACFIVLVLLAHGGPALGQPVEPFLQSLAYDDGVPERHGVQQVAGDCVALRFTPTEYPFNLRSVSVLIQNRYGGVTDEMGLRIYSGDGGAPGELLLTGVDFSTEEFDDTWIDIDVTAHNIVIERGDFYVAVVWRTPMSPGLAVDASEPNELRTWVQEDGHWSRLADRYPWAHDDQAMIRAHGGSGCMLSYDDGVYERRGAQQIAGDAVARRFTPLEYPFNVRHVEVYLPINEGEESPDTELELRVYDDNDGAPGDLLLSGVTFGATESGWVNLDLSQYDITIEDGDFYVSVVWLTPMTQPVGIDISEPNEQRTWVCEGGQWSLLADIYPWAYQDQAMIRVSDRSLYVVSYDDGIWERAGIQQDMGDCVALRVTPPVYPFHVEKILVNVRNMDSVPHQMGLRIHGDDDGVPGDLLVSGLRFMAPPLSYYESTWVEVDVSSHNIVMNEGDFYPTVIWLEPMGSALGIDISGPNEYRTWVREAGRWGLLASSYPWAYEDQVMIRAIGGPSLPLTGISLLSPQDGALLASRPTFTWSVDGGTRNVFAVELSRSLNFSTYWSTYENLHQLISGTSWTMPRNVWRAISPGERIYWRVRGADLDEDLTPVTSGEVWSFRKK